jgi:hypothetical protein
MNNASFHNSEQIAPMFADACVKLFYLPPCSPDLNPIEEFFAQLKGFIRRNWTHYKKESEQGFKVLLEWCIDVVGVKEESAQCHFRHAGLKTKFSVVNHRNLVFICVCNMSGCYPSHKSR